MISAKNTTALSYLYQYQYMNMIESTLAPSLGFFLSGVPCMISAKNTTALSYLYQYQLKISSSYNNDGYYLTINEWG